LIESNLPDKTRRPEMFDKLSHLGPRKFLEDCLSNLTNMERLREDGDFVDHNRVRSEAALMRPIGAWYQGAKDRDQFVPLTPRGKLHVISGKESE
jgi:hypothetical protein